MNLWSWGGKYIGNTYGEILYSKKGNPIGLFVNDELYDFSGKYIGEKRDYNRLIVNKSSKRKRISLHSKPCNMCGTSYCDYAGNAMLVGYEDFKYE